MAQHIGLKLQQLREKAGATVYYVANRLNLSLGELSEIERGYAKANDNLIRDYIEALHHLRSNSLPDVAPGELLWTAPRSTEKAVW